MAIVRVIIWDEANFLQRISEPEDTFLIEAIDASGSDSNIIKIGPLSASNIYVGREGVGTFVSGVLSGSFITGTFYGDGSNLRGLVSSLNALTGSITLVAGPGVTISSGSGQIVLSASISGAATVSSLNGFIGDINVLSSSDFLKINSVSNQIIITASHRPIDQLVHSVAENSYEEFTYNGPKILSATIWTSPAKTVKIREENYIYDIADRIATSSLIQFNAGVEVERLTQRYTYSGPNIISITGTLT